MLYKVYLITKESRIIQLGLKSPVSILIILITKSNNILNHEAIGIDFDKVDEGTLTEPIPIIKKEKEEIGKYIEMIQINGFATTENNKVGTIVMNYNPITKGHLYLIDEASKQADYLYIFIVEEERSFFLLKIEYP